MLDTQLNSDKVQPLQYGDVPTTCPCCNSEIISKVESVCFDYWKGRVFQGDKQVWLQPMEADLLKILLDNWPKLCSKEKLLVGLWGGNYSEKINLISSDNTGVCLSTLRSKLKIFHIKIQNVSSRGWWLVKQSEEDCRISKRKITGYQALLG